MATTNRPTTTETTNPKRKRLPLTKFTAAAAIDKILQQIPPEQRAGVLAFVAVPHEGQQLTLGNV